MKTAPKEYRYLIVNEKILPSDKYCSFINGNIGPIDSSEIDGLAPGPKFNSLNDALYGFVRKIEDKSVDTLHSYEITIWNVEHECFHYYVVKALSVEGAKQNFINNIFDKLGYATDFEISKLP